MKPLDQRGTPPRHPEERSDEGPLCAEESSSVVKGSFASLRMTQAARYLNSICQPRRVPVTPGAMNSDD